MLYGRILLLLTYCIICSVLRLMNYYLHFDCDVRCFYVKCKYICVVVVNLYYLDTKKRVYVVICEI